MAFCMYCNTRCLFLIPLSGYHFPVLQLEDRVPLPKKKKKFNYIEDQILFETTASEDNSYHLLATLVCQLTPSRAIIQKIL